MSSSVSYLTEKSTFKQISEQIPITRARPAEKVDSEEVFESGCSSETRDAFANNSQVPRRSLYLNSFANPSKSSY